MARRSPWHRSAERAQLLALYAEADALVEGWSCRCTPSEDGPGGDGASAAEAAPHCCHFEVTGREPYPSAVELEEVRHAIARRPARRRDVSDPRLQLLRACPLLSGDGRCTIYASRPLGCRTFFCSGARAPFGARPEPPRAALRTIAQRIADLSARFAPNDPHPRPLVRALAGQGRTQHVHRR
ncbi:MAG TPA: YkgJ family cysteine cluster protein [Polyangiaceae bacterium]|nr:YkgJ family cysteine cluster protein [Polyangiaceae bacterium]